MSRKEVFVSSTFKDFQTERDLLNNEILNKINDVLRTKIGTTISFLDLRYGINTYGDNEHERVKSAAISSVQNVNKTKPLFLIFVGNRYGTSIDVNEIASIYHFFTKSNPKVEKSITEIEFDFSSFNSGIEFEKSYCFLLKRNIKNDTQNDDYFDKNTKGYRLSSRYFFIYQLNIIPQFLCLYHL